MKPILFSTDMVKAILGGRKQQNKIYAPKGMEDDPKYLIRRLVNGLDIIKENECWEWKRAKNGYGYGTLTVKGKTVLAHRLVYELCNGLIPKGMNVCHKCDNPACINPKHLFLGTRSDNMQDCSRKGRIVNPINRMPGELNPASKLNRDNVLEIRRRLKNGEVQALIAKDYCVSQSQISNIKRHFQWNCV